MDAAINQFFQSQAGQAAIGVLAVAFLDLAFAVAAALTPPNTFSFAKIADFLGSHILSRVIPIWALLFVGFATQDIQLAGISVILTAGLAGAVAYVAETIASIVSTVKGAQTPAA